MRRCRSSTTAPTSSRTASGRCSRSAPRCGRADRAPPGKLESDARHDRPGRWQWRLARLFGLHPGNGARSGQARGRGGRLRRRRLGRVAARRRGNAVSDGRRAAHSRRYLARRCQHRDRRRRDGVRLPASRVPAHGAPGVIAVAQSLREQVAWACRIIALEGYADLTLGHVSARDAEGVIWIKRKGVALDEVEPEDVVPLGDTDATLHLETVLHEGVYRARPDVGAVIHGHPPYATALGATRTELEILTHDGILFADGLGRFSDPDLIVDDE